MENKDQMSLGKPKNKFLLLASTLFVLLIVLLLLVIFNNRSNTPVAPNQAGNTTTDGTTMSGSPNNQASVVATAPPMVSVASWTGIKAPASVPTSASVYTFKTGYTFDEAQTIATNLGINGKAQKNNDMAMIYSLPSDTDSNASLLAYKLSNGTFIYNSSEGVALPAGGTTEQKVITLLKTLGVYDSTLTSVSTYKDKTQQGMLYMELHRNWKSVGLPILSPVGLMNVPENVPLSTLSLASRTANLPQNTNIYATSDRTDGYVRKDDFNTVTVSIDETTQKVMVIKSGIRPFATAAPNTSSLLTFDQAVDKLKAGQYEFALTTPSGEGADMPWDKIYPMNKAEAQSATVTDSVIVYLEKPSSATQTELMPYYVFRANAMLSSGYRANIIAAVPATAKPEAFLLPFIGVNAQAGSFDSQGQQQGTFNMNATPTQAGGFPTTAVTLPPGTTVTPNPNGNGETLCNPTASALNPVYNLGGAIYGWANFRNDTGATNKNGFWYYVPTENDTALLTNLANILRTLEGGVVGQPVNQATTAPQPTADVTVYQTETDDQGQKQGTFYVPTVAVSEIPLQQGNLTVDKVRKIEKVIKDVSRIAEFCPLRVSGDSPTIFIYGESGANVQVQSGAEVSFADPVVTNIGSWNVNIGTNGSLKVNGLDRDFIYYEYQNASFDRPSTGWNVKRTELASLVSGVSAKLGLNSKEAARLAFEVNHAASRVQGDKLFVGLISQSEVDSQLPLSVTSGYAVHRTYFYVGAAGAQTVAPAVAKIVRSPSMVVELGSYAAK